MKKNPFFTHAKKTALGIVLVMLMITSCKRDDGPDTSLNNSPAPDVNFYALTLDNKLIYINAKNPDVILNSAPITGLKPNEKLLGIDFRPAGGQLYGIGSRSELYTINTKTGVADIIYDAPFAATVDLALSAVDFDPVNDLIHVVSPLGRNLFINPVPTDGGIISYYNGNIFDAADGQGSATVQIIAAAYTHNRAAATTTELYDIDIKKDKLFKHAPGETGALTAVGPLGFDVEGVGGFDINPEGTIALAALTLKATGKTGLFTIDLATGKATKVGDCSATITSVAIPTDPIAYAVNPANELLIFNPLNPSPIAKPITGLPPGVGIVGIDIHPEFGYLYGLGNNNTMYLINVTTGQATLKRILYFALSGTSFGFDFDPTSDSIRVISNTGQNLRVSSANGTSNAATTDTPLPPGTTGVCAAAYTNNFDGATTTTLYVIDSQTDKLFRMDPANKGTLVEIGPLGVNVDDSNGFDIGGTSGKAYALLTVSGATKVYTINLTTGAATAVADFPQAVKGFALGLGF